MAESNGTHQPWSALKSLLSIPATKRSTRQHHPKRRILRAYLAENLPERPAAWTRDRVEALAAGTLEEWTRWEVAAHVAICSRCRRSITALDARVLRLMPPGIVSLMHILRQPKWATVGWAFAGMQAVALAVLLLWGVFSSLPELPMDKPMIYPSLDKVSQMSGFPQASAVWVELEPNAPWEEVTVWLQSLELEVHGPDAEGRYLLLGEEVEPSELEQNQWVLRVESVRGGDGE